MFPSLAETVLIENMMFLFSVKEVFDLFQAFSLIAKNGGGEYCASSMTYGILETDQILDSYKVWYNSGPANVTYKLTEWKFQFSRKYNV